MQPLHMSRRKQLCKGMGCWILCMHWRALYQCCVLHESRALRRIAGGRGLLLLSFYPCINMLTVISTAAASYLPPVRCTTALSHHGVVPGLWMFHCWCSWHSQFAFPRCNGWALSQLYVSEACYTLLENKIMLHHSCAQGCGALPYAASSRGRNLI